MVVIMQSHSCLSHLLIPPMNRLFALFHAISQNSSHLFHLSLHHDTSTSFLHRCGLHVHHHKPCWLLYYSIHCRGRSTQPSRLEPRSYIIARSIRKSSHNDSNNNIIASPRFEHCFLWWFRHEPAPSFAPLLSPNLGRIRPDNGHKDVVQGAAATQVRRGQIRILLQPRPSHRSANKSRWGRIKTEEMFKMYVCIEWNALWPQTRNKSSFHILIDFSLFGEWIQGATPYPDAPSLQTNSAVFAKIMYVLYLLFHTWKKSI